MAAQSRELGASSTRTFQCRLGPGGFAVMNPHDAPIRRCQGRPRGRDVSSPLIGLRHAGGSREGGGLSVSDFFTRVWVLRHGLGGDYP